jgi:hypothetical protein
VAETPDPDHLGGPEAPSGSRAPVLEPEQEHPDPRQALATLPPTATQGIADHEPSRLVIGRDLILTWAFDQDPDTPSTRILVVTAEDGQGNHLVDLAHVRHTGRNLPDGLWGPVLTGAAATARRALPDRL